MIMEKIKKWLLNYKEKSSRLKIAGDIIFWLFILLMLIPVTRREISAFIIKVTLMKPRMEDAEVENKLSDKDYLLSFSDISTGEITRLNDFKGEIILLNFWATWCPPCRAEMPSLQYLYNDYHDKIKFVLISNEDENKIIEYFNESNYDMPAYIQRSELPPSFPVGSIPTSYLIGRNGQILVEKTGAANWNSEKFRKQLDDLIAF
jgi:thiol-disulfide isomerase/thioredoxin